MRFELRLDQQNMVLAWSGKSHRIGCMFSSVFSSSQGKSPAFSNVGFPEDEDWEDLESTIYTVKPTNITWQILSKATPGSRALVSQSQPSRLTAHRLISRCEGAPKSSTLASIIKHYINSVKHQVKAWIYQHNTNPMTLYYVYMRFSWVCGSGEDISQQVVRGWNIPRCEMDVIYYTANIAFLTSPCSAYWYYYHSLTCISLECYQYTEHQCGEIKLKPTFLYWPKLAKALVHWYYHIW